MTVELLLPQRPLSSAWYRIQSCKVSTASEISIPRSRPPPSAHPYYEIGAVGNKFSAEEGGESCPLRPVPERSSSLFDGCGRNGSLALGSCRRPAPRLCRDQTARPSIVMPDLNSVCYICISAGTATCPFGYTP